MAVISRRYLIELIQRQLSGGQISDDSDLTDELINLYINGAIGFCAKAAYKEEIQLNGIEGVNDGFYAEFTGIVITKDTVTGQYKATFPQQPAGVGTGWDVADFMLIKGSGAKIFASPITPKEVRYLYSLPSGCNEVYFWMNGVTASIHSCNDITKYKANVRMLSTQSSNLDAPITLPDGYWPMAIDYLDKTLGIQLNIPIDISNDGVPSPQIR